MDNNFNNEEREKLLDNKLSELANDQNQNLVIDFDQAIEEEQENFIEIIFENKKYKLANKMPFNFAMFFFRNCFKKVGNKTIVEIPDELTMTFIEKMFGKEFYTSLIESNKNFSFDLIFKNLGFKVLKAWGIDFDSPEAQKKIQEMKETMSMY